MKIKHLRSREIIDSRGNPTVEADITFVGDYFGRASVPSGASVGSKEAIELRDKDGRFGGKGVQKAVSNINNVIFDAVNKKEFNTQRSFDEFIINLDGTDNKSKLGANSILACSLAFAKASASYLNIPLYKYIGNHSGNHHAMPTPMINIINGGAHADNLLDFQEFMIIPSNKIFKEALRTSAEVFHSLKKLLSDKGFNTNVGDEGGFAPDLTSTEDALDFIIKAIEKTGYRIAEDFNIGLDVAASEFYKDKKYRLEDDKKILETDVLIEYYEKLIVKYPIISIEDPLSEFDFNGWKTLTRKIGSKVRLVGDDIFVTNPEIIKNLIEEKIANAVLIKPNQIGTLSETLDAVDLVMKNNYEAVISHRSGETEDVTIAHLAVGTGCKKIKTGSMSRTDRVCKYNELLRIEEEIMNSH
jgi:enolase